MRFYISNIDKNNYNISDIETGDKFMISESELTCLLYFGYNVMGANLYKNSLYAQPLVFNESSINMAKRLLVDSIWKSAKLEGLGTTFPDTEMVLENIPVALPSSDISFILNMRSAWNFVLDSLNCRNDLSLLRQLNMLVGSNLIQHCGEVRTSPVKIGGTSWTPDIPILSNLYGKITELLDIENNIIKACKYFCFVARTQIFLDGNKRVAQLIANKVLIENDIGILQVPVEKLSEFKNLLLKFYETGNDTDIILFLIKNCIIFRDYNYYCDELNNRLLDKI